MGDRFQINLAWPSAEPQPKLLKAVAGRSDIGVNTIARRLLNERLEMLERGVGLDDKRHKTLFLFLASLDPASTSEVEKWLEERFSDKYTDHLKRLAGI